MSRYIGTFKVLKEVGQGGFAVVYKTKNQIGKVRALKVSKKKNIFQEAQILADLEHSNIISVYEYHKDLDAIEMEYMSKGNLADLLKKDGLLNHKKAIQIIVNILEALQYIHKLGYIHQDIKPANILFDSSNTVKLSDFGLAKLIEKEIQSIPLEIRESGVLNTVSFSSISNTESNDSLNSLMRRISKSAIRGTLPYMAKEHIEGNPNKQSDIYSAGLILYEMLVGELPSDPFPKLPSQVDKATPKDLDQICITSTESLDKRYKNAEEMINDLNDILKENLSVKKKESSRKVKENHKISCIGPDLRPKKNEPGPVACIKNNTNQINFGDYSGRRFYNCNIVQALDAALEYADEDGHLMSAPELVKARLLAEEMDYVWKKSFYCATEEYVGRTRRDTAIYVVAHGKGILLKPNRLERAFQEELFQEEVPFGLVRLEEEEFHDLIEEGMLSDGSELPLYSYKDFINQSNLTLPYGIVLDYDKVQSSYPTLSKDSEKGLENDPLFIARVGGKRNAEQYIKRTNEIPLSFFANYCHFYDIIDPDIPLGHFLLVWDNFTSGLVHGMIHDDDNPIKRRFVGIPK